MNGKTGQGSNRGRSAGFTLLEVIIALTILAVGILAVIRLFPMALTRQRVAAERTVVASLARTTLSEVRTGGVSSMINEWLARNSYHVIEQAARGYTLYDSWRADIMRTGGSDADLYRVVFSVRMHDGTEQEFVTYMTER